MKVNIPFFECFGLFVVATFFPMDLLFGILYDIIIYQCSTIISMVYLSMGTGIKKISGSMGSSSMFIELHWFMRISMLLFC